VVKVLQYLLKSRMAEQRLIGRIDHHNESQKFRREPGALRPEFAFRKSVKQIYNFLFSAQDFSRNTAAERSEEGSQGWSTQRSGVRNPWIKEVLNLVALKGRQQWLIVEGAVRQSISKYSNLAQLQTTRLLNPCSVAPSGARCSYPN
jgi:hypothetical protein